MSKLEFRVEPPDNERLARLCGQFDEHLKQIEKRLNVSISNRGDQFSVEGDSTSADSARALIDHLYDMTENESLAPEILVPTPVSCKGAKKLVKNAGYKKVKKIECDGTIYTFKAKKNGAKLVVTVNKYSKTISEI